MQIFLFELVAEDIWGFITQQKTTSFAEITEYISSIYDCPNTDDTETDVNDFLQELYANGLISVNSQYTASVDARSTAITSEESDDFEGKIIADLENINQIYSATIEMTYACNESCVHCYAHYPGSQNHSDLSLNDYILFIDQLYAMGALHISFTGGDPFVNPDFCKIFKYAREKGFVCDIFTNGLYLSDNKNILDEIISLRPRAFYISLYGACAAVHDSITQTPGSFKKTINTIKAILSNGIHVVLNVMILSKNYNELPSIIKLASELGAEYRVSMSIINRNDGNDLPMNYFINDKEKILNVLKIVKSRAFSIDKLIGNHYNERYICGAGVTSICLSPDGTINPCVSLKIPLGNIKSNLLKDIWNSKNRGSLIESLKWTNAKKCQNCTKNSFCPHCPGISQSESGDIYSCNTCDDIISSCMMSLNE